MAHVFICHVEEDKELVGALADGLMAAGVGAWYHERDSYPGVSYLRQTSEALSTSSAIILVISSAAFANPYQMRREIIQAFEEHKEFVPILADVTVDEFKSRQPEWHSVTSGATAVRLPQGGISEPLPRLIRGLQALGAVERSDAMRDMRPASADVPQSATKSSTSEAELRTKTIAAGPRPDEQHPTR
jgi:hypothetical protein